MYIVHILLYRMGVTHFIYTTFAVTPLLHSVQYLKVKKLVVNFFSRICKAPGNHTAGKDLLPTSTHTCNNAYTVYISCSYVWISWYSPPCYAYINYIKF